MTKLSCCFCFWYLCCFTLPLYSSSHAMNGIWFLSMASPHMEKEFNPRDDREKCGRIRDRHAMLGWVTDELCCRKFLALLPKNHIIWTWEAETNRQRGQPDITRAKMSSAISDENDGDYHSVWMCMCVREHCGMCWSSAPDDDDVCVLVSRSGWCPWPCKAGYQGLYIWSLPSLQV